MIPVYYINLATRTDRRRYMEAQFSRLGIAAQRVEAVTPADISDDDRHLYCNPSRPTFLRENELACTLSHERAWRAMAETGIEQALVLEDDVELSAGLPRFLEHAATVKAELIRVETTGKALRVFAPIGTLPGGVALREFRSTPYGSAGYVIRSSGAERILASGTLRTKHMDLALYNPFEAPGSLVTRLLTDPAMCRQLNMTGQSDTSEARSDIAGVTVPHTYAKAHPFRFFVFKLVRGTTAGVRNFVDHLRQMSRRVERRVIPFE